MKTQANAQAPSIATEKLQAMLNFASKSILNMPMLYQQAQQQSDSVVEKQISHWKSFQ